jgi:hypothetical protein
VFLPCLGCGKWEFTTNRNAITTATQAVVNYRLHAPPDGKPPPWGPFPFRFKDGSICFPGQSGGGWVWRDEYVAGEALFSKQVEFKGAWIYNTDCVHRPFADVPKFYLERLRIGKEGPGYILKLGPNAIYGKTAQSIGQDPPYQSWPWAGMITSGCRAQMLHLMALHSDLRDLFMIATDGAYTTACEFVVNEKGERKLVPKFAPPLPRETNTGPAFARNEFGKAVDKPLGGWETKPVERGMFAARPGIYFPLDATEEEIEAVRARGLGRSVMYECAPMAVDAWERGETQIHVKNVGRFHGAKSCIHRGRLKDGSFKFHRADGPPYDSEGKPRRRYGQWTSKEIKLDFDPKPKREYPEGYIVGQRNRWPVELAVRMLPKELESMPYKRALQNYGPDADTEHDDYGGPEAVAMCKAMREYLEQPEGGDYTEYEVEERYENLSAG